jgi:hypothetical protein
MSEYDIKIYLGDTTDLPDEQIASLSRLIYFRLDYSSMYEQIDNLVKLLAAPAQAG